jgi:hypothetical protein
VSEGAYAAVAPQLAIKFGLVRSVEVDRPAVGNMLLAKEAAISQTSASRATAPRFVGYFADDASLSDNGQVEPNFGEEDVAGSDLDALDAVFARVVHGSL